MIDLYELRLMTFPETDNNALHDTTTLSYASSTNSTVSGESSAFVTVLESLGIAAIIIAVLYGIIKVCSQRVRQMHGYDCESICDCCLGGIRDFFLWIRDGCRNCYQGMFTTDGGGRDRTRTTSGRERSDIDDDMPVTVELRRPSADEETDDESEWGSCIRDPPPTYDELTVGGNMDRIPSYEEAIGSFDQYKTTKV